MNKEELFKKYQEIVLKTNGGADDYVVALCQISNLIKEFAEEKDQQITDLQKQLATAEKALELAVDYMFKELKLDGYQDMHWDGSDLILLQENIDCFKEQAKEMLESE